MRPFLRLNARRLLHSQPLMTPVTLLESSPYVRSLPSAADELSTSSSSSSSASFLPQALAQHFIFYPQFFSPSESRELLRMALWKLDRADSTRKRRQRRGGQTRSPSGSDVESTAHQTGAASSSLQDMFEGEYGFEEGHYDSVIHHCRETLLSNLPPDTSDTLKALLFRLYALLPTKSASKFVPAAPTVPGSALSDSPPAPQLPPPSTLTHLLHLAPHGSIQPHVDNLEASGRVILGLSLGAERILRLRGRESGSGSETSVTGLGWDVRLTSGSVYVQRDSVRYEYEHSILPYEDEGSRWDGKSLEAGHRISIMIRDAPSMPSKL